MLSVRGKPPHGCGLSKEKRKKVFAFDGKERDFEMSEKLTLQEKLMILSFRFKQKNLDLAKNVGACPATVRAWLNGSRLPTTGYLGALALASEGLITTEDFVNLPEPVYSPFRKRTRKGDITIVSQEGVTQQEIPLTPPPPAVDIPAPCAPGTVPKKRGRKKKEVAQTPTAVLDLDL